MKTLRHLRDRLVATGAHEPIGIVLLVIGGVFAAIFCTTITYNAFSIVLGGVIAEYLVVGLWTITLLGAGAFLLRGR